MIWLHLLGMLLVILLASHLFTNALEHVGWRTGLSAGVVGSIFAAIATALPETSVPIIALVAGGSNVAVNEEISVGAILGAPLMLSTLSTFLIALFVLKQRGLRGKIVPEKTGSVRDLNFFLIAFFLAAMAMYIPLHPVYIRTSISFLLIALYAAYLVLTCRASKDLVAIGHGVQPEQPILFTYLGLQRTNLTIGIQLISALALLLFGAKGLIHDMEGISQELHISALLLSLLIIPFATELPEKVNSILWVRQHKDTLGFGNITGAMVFQGTLLPALGILLTPWGPTKIVQGGIIVTLCAAASLRLQASRGGLFIPALLLQGILYFLYLYWVLH